MRKLLANLEGGIWSKERNTVSNQYYFISSYEVRNARLIGKRVNFIGGVASTSETGSTELKSNRATLTLNDLHPSCNPVTIQFSQNNETIEESFTCFDGIAQTHKLKRQ